MSNAFTCLNPHVQKWVYQQGWTDLRDIQQQAIAPILAANCDLIISASTAAGKTEAAFLPACSAIADVQESFGVLYISPLKALINDQYRRLEGLCDALKMPVTPWHGDSSQAMKKRARQNPQGVLLITPESLEALLIRQAGWVKAAFSDLRYIIIDEYHAFVGFERGCHLQSLMHRLEHVLERQQQPIPRVALSATLGDMDSVIHYLRPNKTLPCELIVGQQAHAPLKIQVRGYVEKNPAHAITDAVHADEFIDESLNADEQVASDLYRVLRGDSHLIFANSRQRTERFAVMLSERCEQNHVPNEFFPHHGSLAKELREFLEARLQKEQLPTTAVCTMTLELGIDIGKVQSVAQVTAPHSVASLRQRVGRSGRRGSSAILRMYITERELTGNATFADKLRLELLQSLAMVRLLLRDKWYEPPDTQQYHFSTFLHQILAIIAQWGGVRVEQLWALLRDAGPFNNITIEHFKTLLTHMGGLDLLTQLQSGELVLGKVGEQLVNHYTFYSVFKTPEEYRLIVDGKTLGTLPIDSPLFPEQYIVFGGRYWQVCTIDEEKKTIVVMHAKSGTPPKFSGGGMSLHDRVRQEMYQIYQSGDYHIQVAGAWPEFLDVPGQSLFKEGLECFQASQLATKFFIEHGNTVYLIPWMGDKIVNTLTVLLLGAGYQANQQAGIITITNTSQAEVKQCLKQMVDKQVLSNTCLASTISNKYIAKYDDLLPEELLHVTYGAYAFDMENTCLWLSKAI